MGTEFISRITDYINKARKNNNLYPLDRVGVFIVDGAVVYDNAPVTNPEFHVPRIGIVQGRFIDVIGWAVKHQKFYHEGQSGEVLQEKRNVTAIPIDKSLDFLLDNHG